MYIVHTILAYNNFHSLSEIIYSLKHANTADQDFGRTYSSTYIAINYSNLKIKNKNKNKNKNKKTKTKTQRIQFTDFTTLLSLTYYYKFPIDHQPR